MERSAELPTTKLRVNLPLDGWDTIVVGAGPAGTAAAISAARLRMRVLLVEAKQFPRRKVCGGCLNQVSIALAKQLLGEEHPLWTSSPRIDRFAMHYAGRNSQFALPGGMAIHRELFDQALVDEACSAGVTFVDSTTAKLGELELDCRSVMLSDSQGTRTIRSQTVVLAGGLGSRAAGRFGDLTARATTDSRVGVEALFDEFPSDYVRGAIHMVVGACGYVGLTQLADGRLHVAAAVDRRSIQRIGPAGCVRDILVRAGAPVLLESPAQVWRGTPPLTCRVQKLADARVFLVGDAAGYVEPFTGEGIRWGLQTGIGVAPLLRRAADKWDDRYSADWTRWYRRHITPSQRLCRKVSFGLRHASTRWLAHHLLKIQPQMAQWIIARLNSDGRLNQSTSLSSTKKFA